MNKYEVGNFLATKVLGWENTAVGGRNEGMPFYKGTKYLAGRTYLSIEDHYPKFPELIKKYDSSIFNPCNNKKHFELVTNKLSDSHKELYSQFIKQKTGHIEKDCLLIKMLIDQQEEF